MKPMNMTIDERRRETKLLALSHTPSRSERSQMSNRWSEQKSEDVLKDLQGKAALGEAIKQYSGQ